MERLGGLLVATSSARTMVICNLQEAERRDGLRLIRRGQAPTLPRRAEPASPQFEVPAADFTPIRLQGQHYPDRSQVHPLSLRKELRRTQASTRAR